MEAVEPGHSFGEAWESKVSIHTGTWRAEACCPPIECWTLPASAERLPLQARSKVCAAVEVEVDVEEVQ